MGLLKYLKICMPALVLGGDYMLRATRLGDLLSDLGYQADFTEVSISTSKGKWHS